MLYFDDAHDRRHGMRKADTRDRTRICGKWPAIDKMRIEGSPSLVLNEGRQKLYGNVGFRLIEANVQGLINAPAADDASWC